MGALRCATAVGALSACGLLLVGCTANTGRDHPAPGPASASPPLGAGPTGTGRVGDPRIIECHAMEAHQPITRVPDGDDVVAGPLWWPGLRRWADGDPADYGTGADFKIGAFVRAGATVTVTVPDSAASVAGLNYGQRWTYTAAQSVTFQGCPDADTAYVGGFHVEGRRCVPLDVRARGAEPVRVTVSFFAGPC